MQPNRTRGPRPLILPKLLRERDAAQERPPQRRPIDPEVMMRLRQGWAVRLDDGIQHAEAGGWGLSQEDYATAVASLRRARRFAMPPAVGSSRDGERIRQTLRVPADLPVDWAHLVWHIQEKARQPYNVAQQMQVRTLMNNWQSVLMAITSSIDQAYDSIQGVVDTMTMQRRASLAVSGRITWGLLSTMVPPPLGVGMGAIVLWMVDDKHSDGIMKLLEWWLQMPFLFDTQTGRVVAPTYGNRYSPDVQHRFAPAFNPGGQATMKDTKDFNQMLKGIEKLFSGDKRKVIDQWDRTTIKFLIARLKKLKGGNSNSLKQGFETAIGILTDELQNALHEVIAEYEDPDSSRRLIHVLFELKRDDIMTYADRPDVVTHMMQELISYFFNRLVHNKLVEIRDQARIVPPTITGEFRTNVTNWAQVALLASYFRDNVRPAADPAEASGESTTPQEQVEINTRGGEVVRYGLFKSNLVAPALSSYFGNAMERKLTELGIVHKQTRQGGPATVGARWLTRGPAPQMDIEAQPWAPGVLPIPYKNIGDRITRARLAAWARDMVARLEDPARYTNAFQPDGMLRAMPRGEGE